MSDITRAERITWQRQATALLGNLLALAAKQDLPVLTWTVRQAGASATGQFLGEPRSRGGDFAAWKAAITAAAGREPDHDNEHTFGGDLGEKRLTCGWDQLPLALAEGSPRYPAASLTLTASTFPEEGSDE
jgi:hypothetical protein